MGKNNFILTSEVIKLSESKNWEEAKKEWKPFYIFNQPNNTCLCSHHPITENIVMKNKTNSNEIIIGNCCIKKFWEIKDFTKYFKALKENRINQSVINISFEKKIINEWEKNFISNLWRKKKLTEKQILKFNGIKERILKKLKKEDNYEK